MNRGEFKLKMRGSRKDGLAQSMRDARQKVLTVSKTQSTSVETKFSAMSVARYKEVYGKTPQQAGLETTTRMCDGKATEIVLFRNLPEGEWDLTVKDESAARQEEIIDNGKSVIRESQQDNIFQGLASAATSALSVKAVLPSDRGNQQPNITQDNTYIKFDMGMILFIYYILYTIYKL